MNGTLVYNGKHIATLMITISKHCI